MSLLDVLRSGVAIADSVTKPLQCTVMVARYAGTDGFGSDIFYDPVPMKAICDWKQQMLRTAQGQLTVSRVVVTFLDIKEMETVTEGNGIDDRDQIVLPDGTTGPILDMSGFIDAGTGQPMSTEVMLG